MKKISLIILLGFILNLNAIQNPYKKNFNSEQKLSILTNYLIQKEFEIVKPIYPQKPSKPYIKKAKSLVKGKFEKTSTFTNRINIVKQKREKYISSIEIKYKNDVLSYNKKVQDITIKYNDKIKELKNNLKYITTQAMSKAYSTVYGKPILKAIDYDADNEMFYGNLTFSKK